MTNRANIEQWLKERLAEALELGPSELDPARPFSFYGLQSSTIIPIAGELEAYVGRRLSPTLLFEYPSIASLADYLSTGEGATTAAGAAEQETEHARAVVDDSRTIAIIGMACRFPGARSLSEYWSLLASGRSAVTTIPAERWDIEAFYDADPHQPGKSISKWGGFLQKAAAFDAAFFGVSPREALRMDPQQRHALEVAWEALENACQTPERLSGSNTGVFIGVSHVEYSHVQFRDLDQIDGFAAAGNSLSIAANRLSYAFDLRGPSLALDTACSSSLVAVHLACASLRRGECSMALAGGANFNLLPEISIALSKAGILAPDGRCKPFDQRADGYVRGEGVGVLVLKPLAAALRDGDPIHALIRGSAVTHDGKSNGIMAPSQRAQERAIADACRDAGVVPSQIDYVEAHGTGTFLGDAIEAKALGAVVGANRGEAGPCRIGSVKSNIGHLEPAAGIASLIKVVLALRHAQLPASLNCETKSSEIPFEQLGLDVQTELGPWPVGERARRAGVSAFGFGGANAHVVLEEHREREPAAQRAEDQFAVSLLSARSKDSLGVLARELAGYAREAPVPGQPYASLADISSTLATRRIHHHERVAIVSRSREGLSAQLEAFVGGKRAAQVYTGSRAPGRRPSVCFVFSGQGGQWPYAGTELARRYPVFHDKLAECGQAFARAGVPSLLQDLETASTTELENTDIAQRLIFACQVSLAALFESWGLQPGCLIGHSVGEVAAAYVSGALDLEAAAEIVIQRARLMQPLKGSGQMLAVRASEQGLRAALAECGSAVGIAAINGPRSWVLSGELQEMEQLRVRLEAQGFTTHTLRSAFPFHSPQTARLAPALEQALAGLAPRSGRTDYISTVTGALLDGAMLNGNYWARNAAECVSFGPAVECAKSRGVELFLELGPHPLLVNDIQAASGRDAAVVAIGTLRRDLPEQEALACSLAALYANGVDLAWAQVFDEERGVALPSSPWQHQDYWLNTGVEDTPSTAPRKLGRRWVAGEHFELVSQPGAHVFNGMRDKRLKSLLRGRQRSGRSLFSEALQLEALLQSAHGAGNDNYAVVELQLESEVELESAPQPMQISLLPQWPGRWSIALHTRSGHNGQAQWRRLLSGILLANEGAPALTIAALDPAQHQFVAADDWLRRLSELGVELGKAGVVTGIAIADGEALLRLALPENARAEASDFVIHPALLDSCFQLAAVVLDTNAHARRVKRIERVSVTGVLGATAFARLRLPKSGQSTESLRVEIQLFDASGRAVVELAGVELAPVNDSHVLADTAGKDVWLYDLAWQARGLADAAARPSTGDGWLILADRSTVADRLAEELSARGERCLKVWVTGSGGAQPLPADALCVDPDATGAFEKLFRDIEGRGFTNLRGIVHCWAASLPAFSATDLDVLAEAERVGCRSLLHLTQALQRANFARAPRLWVVTRGARAVVPADEADLALAQAPIWGFARGVDLELPEYECSLIDLDPHRDDGDAASAVDELLGAEEERQVAFRDGQRLVARLAPTELPGPDAKPQLSVDGTYLITGGLGGIGFEVAHWLARQGARSLALVGRSKPGPDVAARLSELERAGVAIKVLSADVTDPASLGSALAAVRRDLRPLKGVIHAAGVVDDGALLDLDRGRLARVLAPKVQGAWNLEQLTRSDPLDFFVMFSSVASLLGNPGQTNYNAANCFLDGLSYVRRGQGRPALSINWGPWAEVGMLMRAGDRLKKAPAHLVKLIAPKQGLLLLERLMGRAAAQVAVMPWDIPTLRRYYPAGPGQKLFTEQVSGEDGAADAPAAQRPSERPLLRQDYVAPRNETETLIAQIWQTTLNLEQVGVCDNFFELGGDSVLGGQIISKVNRTFTVSVNVRESFAVFTVEELAKAVQRQHAERLSSLSDAEVELLLREEGLGSLGSG